MKFKRSPSILETKWVFGWKQSASGQINGHLFFPMMSDEFTENTFRIDITTLGRGHGRVCLAAGNSHISPFVKIFCQGKFTTSVP